VGVTLSLALILKKGTEKIRTNMATVINMPALSPSMEEGEVAAWHKKVGDTVKVGDLLAEITTDKATMDFESPNAGVLLHIGIEAGGKALVDALLCIIGNAGEDVGGLINGADNATTAATPMAAAPTVIESVPTAAQASSSDTTRVKASPLAKNIAEQAGIALNNIAGSGDNGRITKKDVEQAISNSSNAVAPIASKALATPIAPPAPVAPKAVAMPAAAVSTFVANAGDSFTDVPVSSMRRVIAQRLSESKFSAPHFYLTVEIDMDKAIEIRQQINVLAAPIKVSFNDMVVKAVAAALKKHAAVNSSWLGDKIRYYQDVHIGVAVAVAEGLLVPVVKHADMKTLSQINSEVREMAGRAKELRLKPEEMSGSTFTISNLGMFDIEEFTAIINPPNACILAVGSIMKKPVVKNNEIVVGNTMKVTLSADHRVVDGASGAQFLQTFKAILEDPLRLLV
jgi:pyruvate dehydrogenase E2 component (dihydrolipoamide acetyltransferase)